MTRIDMLCIISDESGAQSRKQYGMTGDYFSYQNFLALTFTSSCHHKPAANTGVMTVATWFWINAQNLYSWSSWNDASNKSGFDCYANDGRPRSLLTITKRDQGDWPIWISENWLSLKSIMDTWRISLSVYWVTFTDLMSVILTGYYWPIRS